VIDRADKPADDAVEWHSRIAARFRGRYAQSALFRERLSLWSSAISACVTPHATVADLGCGPGIFSLVAAERAAAVYGLDGSSEMIKLARKLAADAGVSNLTFVEARLERFMDSVPAQLDVIICSSVLEYLDDPGFFISACHKTLKAGGTMLISAPNDTSIYRKAERMAYRMIRRPRYLRYWGHVGCKRNAADLLEETGFVIREVRHFGRVPLLSPLFRPVGLAKFADTMVLYKALKT
jgi:2-polyprenyl-6-hydroxyphenyl methylase/3-demethylubiquinone-9 3-methyltransferase